jgi:hypothetical protein
VPRPRRRDDEREPIVSEGWDDEESELDLEDDELELGDDLDLDAWEEDDEEEIEDDEEP